MEIKVKEGIGHLLTHCTEDLFQEELTVTHIMEFYDQPLNYFAESRGVIYYLVLADYDRGSDTDYFLVIPTTIQLRDELLTKHLTYRQFVEHSTHTEHYLLAVGPKGVGYYKVKELHEDWLADEGEYVDLGYLHTLKG